MRNNKGQFVKGHEPLARPKYELMKKYPKILCASCYMNSDCPDYQNGSVCANKREFKKFVNRNLNEVIDTLRTLTEKSYKDMQFFFVKEIISGKYSRKATSLVNKNRKRLLLLYQIYEQIENSKFPHNPKQKSIIDKLFGDIIT